MAQAVRSSISPHELSPFCFTCTNTYLHMDKKTESTKKKLPYPILHYFYCAACPLQKALNLLKMEKSLLPNGRVVLEAVVDRKPGTLGFIMEPVVVPWAVYLHACMYVRMYVCMSVCICMYVCSTISSIPDAQRWRYIPSMQPKAPG